jgi:hypothetical protein
MVNPVDHVSEWVEEAQGAQPLPDNLKRHLV